MSFTNISSRTPFLESQTYSSPGFKCSPLKNPVANFAQSILSRLFFKCTQATRIVHASVDSVWKANQERQKATSLLNISHPQIDGLTPKEWDLVIQLIASSTKIQIAQLSCLLNAGASLKEWLALEDPWLKELLLKKATLNSQLFQHGISLNEIALLSNFELQKQLVTSPTRFVKLMELGIPLVWLTHITPLKQQMINQPSTLSELCQAGFSLSWWMDEKGGLLLKEMIFKQSGGVLALVRQKTLTAEWLMDDTNHELSLNIVAHVHGLLELFKQGVTFQHILSFSDSNFRDLVITHAYTLSKVKASGNELQLFDKNFHLAQAKILRDFCFHYCNEIDDLPPRFYPILETYPHLIQLKSKHLSIKEKIHSLRDFITIPENVCSLFDEVLAKQTGLSQEKLSKWISSFLMFCFLNHQESRLLFEDDRTLVILTRLLHHRHQEARLEYLSPLFFYYHHILHHKDNFEIEALWKTHGGHSKGDGRDLLLFLLLTLHLKAPFPSDKSTSLINSILPDPLFKDCFQQSLLIRLLCHLIEDSLLSSCKKQNLLNLIFSQETPKPSKKERAQSIQAACNILAMGQSKQLTSITSYRDLSPLMCKIFQERLEVEIDPIKFEETLGAFKEPHSVLTYFGNLIQTEEGKQKEAQSLLKEFVINITEGKYQERRYDPTNNPHLNQLFQNTVLKDAWIQGAKEHLFSPTLGELQIEDTDDAESLLRIGTDVFASCLRIDQPSNSIVGILGYLHNGQTRTIIIFHQSKILARAIFRLLIDEQNQPVLFLEEHYFNGQSNQTELSKLIEEMAIKRAKTLGVPLTSAEANHTPYPSSLRSLGGRSLFEHVDGADRRLHKGPFTIERAFIKNLKI